MFSVPHGDDGKVLLALVTNKHVIKGATRGRFFFTKIGNNEPQIGKRQDVEITNFESVWYGHPDPEVDIAAMPIAPVLNDLKAQGKGVYIKALSQDQMPTAEQLAQLDVIEEITFVGYPNGLYDRVNLLPIFRRGHTASPVQVDYEGKPIFLIDASVFPGSSGSPVLIYNLGSYGGRNGLVVGTRIFFLGIISSVLFQTAEGKLEFKTIPTNVVPVVTTQEMIDLGIVFKARGVLETVLGLQKQFGTPNKTPKGK